MNSNLIYPGDPEFLQILSGKLSGSTRQQMPSTNRLVVFVDPLTGRMQTGTMDDLEEHDSLDLTDDDYQDWFYG